MDPELVVLVDADNRPVGTAPKAEVHGAATPLHRGFSVFVFDPRGYVLLQQRSSRKLTWPLVWSNSCCGHPGPGEPDEAAARRRLRQELGLAEVELALASADYRYRAEHLGVVENEVCPVWLGFTDRQPRFDPFEVRAIQWTPWALLVEGLRAELAPFYRDLSPWSREQALLLAESDALPSFLSAHGLAP